jgi:transposase
LGMYKEFLERCLADGMSLDQIAKRSGKHPSTVSYWLGKHGLSANGAARHAPKGGLTREELEPLVEEGLTIERIAQRLGIGDTTVRHWLKRHGLKTVGGQRRDALAYARLTGQERFELRCRRHEDRLDLSAASCDRFGSTLVHRSRVSPLSTTCSTKPASLRLVANA